MDIFSEECAVRFGGIDKSNTLTIASTFNFFQEAAISHAELLGVGRDAMKETGQVWVLSRMSVFMERRPVFGETVTIRTWPRGANKLFAVRDYDIRDADGRAAVRGRSGWLILDIEKRRPLRPQIAMEKLPLNDGVDAMSGLSGNEVQQGLAARPEFGAEAFPRVSRKTRAACYSDIDYNGHMNNTRYIQWIQDLFDPEIFENAGQIRLDINYLSELKYGETVELSVMPLEGDPAVADAPKNPLEAFAVEGASKENGGICAFRAELRTGT